MNNTCEIIITDDDADDRELLIQAFNRMHYKGIFQQAENGLALLDILGKKVSGNGQKPDLIILDLNMPMMNGYEVLDKLKKQPSLNNISIVIFTSSSLVDDEIRCRKLGCLQYYKKPYSLSGYDQIAGDLLSIMRAAKPFC